VEIKIYVPASPEWLEEKGYLAELTEEFGGLTLIPNCKGFWLNPKTKTLVKDDITIVQIFCEKGFYELKGKNKLFECLELLKNHLSQTCVAYSLDNDMDFY